MADAAELITEERLQEVHEIGWALVAQTHRSIKEQRIGTLMLECYKEIRRLRLEVERLKQGPEESDPYVRAVEDEELRGGPSAG